MSDHEDNLQSALGRYAGSHMARFHMPGHKGRGLNGFWRDELALWDTTECPGLDNLHEPRGVISNAQNDCAEAFGARHTFFLVNGSSAGVMAMLLCARSRGRVIISRDCHSSAISGATLAGLDADFIIPEYCQELGRQAMVDPKKLDDMLARTNAKSVLITSPNYYGLCADLPELSRVTKKHGAWLLVDAAHGAHFPFSTLLPPSPAGYASMWVNSAHKTLNALGQGALLHIGDDASVREHDVQKMLSLLQTTSPSYLIMASLDWARYSASLDHVWDVHAKKALKLSKAIDELAGLRVLNSKLIGKSGIANVDVTRISVDTRERGVDGYLAADHLLNHGVVVEMCDECGVVCITTPSDPDCWLEALYEGLKLLPYALNEIPPVLPIDCLPEVAMSIREATFANSELVELEKSVGRIVARSIGAYPPGVADTLPGEILSSATIDRLTKRARLGAHVFGLVDGRVCCVVN